MKKLEKNDPRPITRVLLTKLAERANEVAAEVKADEERLRCRHPQIDEFSNFCGECGALTSLANAVESMIPAFGAAFSLQQILRGNAIAEAQRRSVLAHSRFRITAGPIVSVIHG
jgi:hypothetical protein